MTAAAVVRTPDTPPTVVDVELAPLGPADVRVRVLAAGVCHSDLSLATGALAQPMPAVLGHEAAGEVVAIGGAVVAVRPGDAVVLLWSPPCGDCAFCRRDEPWLCARSAETAQPRATLAGTGEPVWPVLGVGAFAEEVVLPERSVLPLPAGVPFEVAALLGCAVATGVGAVRNTAGVAAGETVVVVGCGGVGLSAVMGARAAGAAVVVAVDPSVERRTLALDVGATHAFAPDGEVSSGVRAVTAGLGADHVIEAVGRAETIRLGWRLARRGGTVTVAGVGRKDDQVSFSALEIFHQARRLQGCVFGSTDLRRDLPLLAADYRSGLLPLDRLVGERCGLDGVPRAFERMRAGAGARTIVVPIAGLAADRPAIATPSFGD